MERWRRQWRERGEVGVLSKGSPGRPRLGEKQIARLERELERGPLVHGWADERLTLARVKTLIGRLFHVSYTVEGAWLPLKRHGWSWQQPIRRATERDDAAVELWKRDVQSQGKTMPSESACGMPRGPRAVRAAGSGWWCAGPRCASVGGAPDDGGGEPVSARMPRGRRWRPSASMS